MAFPKTKCSPLLTWQWSLSRWKDVPFFPGYHLGEFFCHVPQDICRLGGFKMNSLHFEFSSCFYRAGYTNRHISLFSSEMSCFISKTKSCKIGVWVNSFDYEDRPTVNTKLCLLFCWTWWQLHAWKNAKTCFRGRSKSCPFEKVSVRVDTEALAKTTAREKTR